MTIDGPGANREPEDRFLACEEALEADFQALIWEAMKAGWGEREACVAIASLADHHMLAASCNAKTEEALRKMRK